MKDFTFEPALWYNMRDKAVLEKCRNIKREDMEYENENGYRVRVVPHPCSAITCELFERVYRSDVENKKTVIIFPNIWRSVYSVVAEMCNRNNVSARNLVTFCMDEWADEQGHVAPITYEHSLGGHFIRDFYLNLREDLRPPFKNVHYFTDDNMGYYSDLIDEAGDGGADLILSATGWAGHTAFIDPGTKKFAAKSLEEFLTLRSGYVDNCRLTVIQNCGGTGGGDYYHTPRYSASIGPHDVVSARESLERHDLTNVGGYASWEKMISRLQLYGPVTPDVPASVYQLTPGTVYVSEEMATPIAPMPFTEF